MQFEELKDPELQEKLKNCKTAEELVALAEEQGIELSDAELDDVAGGSWKCDKACTDFGSPFCNPKRF